MSFPIGTILFKTKPLRVPDRACNCLCIAQTGAASEPRLKSLKDLKKKKSNKYNNNVNTYLSGLPSYLGDHVTD